MENVKDNTEYSKYSFLTDQFPKKISVGLFVGMWIYLNPFSLIPV